MADNLRLTSAFEVVCCAHSDVLTGDETSVLPWISATAPKSAKAKKRRSHSHRRKSDAASISDADDMSNQPDNVVTPPKPRSVKKRRQVENTAKKHVPRRRPSGEQHEDSNDDDTLNADNHNRTESAKPIKPSEPSVDDKSPLKKSKVISKSSKLHSKQSSKNGAGTKSDRKRAAKDKNDHPKAVDDLHLSDVDVGGTVSNKDKPAKKRKSQGIKSSVDTVSKRQRVASDEQTIKQKSKSSRKQSNKRSAVPQSDSDSDECWSARSTAHSAGKQPTFDELFGAPATGSTSKKSTPAVAAPAAKPTIDEPLFDNSDDDDFPQLVIDVPV